MDISSIVFPWTPVSVFFITLWLEERQRANSLLKYLEHGVLLDTGEDLCILSSGQNLLIDT